MSVVKVQLFGSARLEKNNLVWMFTDDKRYRLLAYLALKSDWVSREDLAYLFWANTDSQSARKNLRHLIGRTKTLEGLEELELSSEHLRWSVQTDVLLFRQAVAASAWAEALSLYKGALLTNFATEDSPEFNAWLSAERQKLFELWRTTMLEQVKKLHQTNHGTQHLELLETLFLLDPLDEEVLQTCMKSAAEAGQRQVALRFYDDFASRLERELGLSPPSHLEQLAASIQHASGAGTVPSAVSTAVRPKSLVLPNLVNAFVGREMLMAELSHLFDLRGQRLVTLLGMGGVGKTRTALQFAHEQQKVWDVTFVRLLPLERAEQIPNAMAEGLGLAFRGLESPLDQVAQHIGQSKLLLVLDNFEQVLSGRVYLNALLEQCLNLMLLVTSREALGLQSEQILEVNVFSIPNHLKPEEAMNLEAVQLFVQQAHRVSSNFCLTPKNLDLVLEICRLVDGLALGIELAAVWVRSLELAQIAAEISKNLDFLISQQPDRNSHHRSLRAVFESSWALLVPAEQQALRRLSVFKNGFTKEAMQSVTDVAVVVLSSLIDKSFLGLSQDGRYRRHRLIIGFVQEKLLEYPEEMALAKQKHAQFYFFGLQSGLEQIRSGNSKTALESLELELENIRVAWRWAIEQQHLYYLKTASEALMRFFDARWRLQEAIDFFAEAIVAVKDPATLGTLLIHQAKFTQRLEQNQASALQTKQGLALLEGLNEQQTMIWGLGNLGTLTAVSHAPNQALEYRRQALELAQQLGNERLIAVCLGWVAISADELAEFATAEQHYLEAIALFRQQRNQIGELFNLNSLGTMKLMQKNHAAALELLFSALELAQKTGELYQHCLIELNIGLCYQQLGENTKALFHAQNAQKQSQQLTMPPSMLVELQICLGQLAKTLGLPAHQLNQALEIATSSSQPTLILNVLLEMTKQNTLPSDLAVQIAATVAQHPESQAIDRTAAQAILGQRSQKNTNSTELGTLIQQVRLFLEN